MQPPSKDEIDAGLRKFKFASKTLPYRNRPLFEQGEMDYKRRLGARIAGALKACGPNDRNWPDMLSAAMRSKDNNIVPWQTLDSFRKWFTAKPDSARRLLRSMSDQRKSPVERMTIFSEGLSETKLPRLTQPGAQLALGSVLLMADDPENCPPTRTDVVKFAVEELGLEWGVSKASAADRYDCFLSILDCLIQESKLGPIVLQNRLEAQGIVWCRKSLWMEKNSSSEGDDIEIETPISEDVDIAQAERSLQALASTEREAVIAARRGQGRFRSALLTRWLLGCAVTNCTYHAVLRASHLKPWRICNNAERLSPDNGILLTPALDTLLDQYLISFAPSGRILVSKSLKSDDLAKLGVTTEMRLRKVIATMEPFLKHHRAEFQRMEQKVQQHTRS